MWKYEKEYDKLTDKEKVERLEVLCKAYLMHLNIYDEKHTNILMKDATEYWEYMKQEYSEMGDIMDKRDLKEYGVAHRACQTISDVVEKLENLNTVIEYDCDKMEELLQYLCNIRNNEVNFYINFEIDHCK